MDDLTPDSLVKDALDLISLPDIFLQVNSMIDDPRYVAADIAEVISKDPVLSARVLKLANSPLYGLNGRVDTLTRAMTFIGMNEIRDMLLTTAVVDKFGKIPQSLVDITDFWIRSVQCGVLSRLIARARSVLHAERLFMIGLMHDLGSMVMYCRSPDKSEQVFIKAEQQRSIIPVCEKEIFGFTYADVGHALLREWQLPEAMQQAIAYQLNPAEAPSDFRLDCHILAAARCLCMVSIDGMEFDQALNNLSEHSGSLLDLNKDEIEEILEKMPDDFAEIFNVIVPSSRILY